MDRLETHCWQAVDGVSKHLASCRGLVAVKVLHAAARPPSDTWNPSD